MTEGNVATLAQEIKTLRAQVRSLTGLVLVATALTAGTLVSRSWRQPEPASSVRIEGEDGSAVEVGKLTQGWGAGHLGLQILGDKGVPRLTAFLYENKLGQQLSVFSAGVDGTIENQMRTGTFSTTFDLRAPGGDPAVHLEMGKDKDLRVRVSKSSAEQWYELPVQPTNSGE